MLAALCSVLGCGQQQPTVSNTGAKSAPSGPQANENDARIEALLAGKELDGDKAIPFDEFFAKLGQGHMVWKGEPEWFKKLADDAKAAGSPAVYAVVADAFDSGVLVAAEYVLVMPQDPASRGKVIDAYNNFWKTDWDQLEPEERDELQSEFVQDRGQKYLSLMFDP